MAYNPLAGAYQGLLGEPTWAYTGRLPASVITSTTWQAPVPSNRAVSGVECGSCLGPCGVGDAGPVADRTAKRPGELRWRHRHSLQHGLLPEQGK